MMRPARRSGRLRRNVRATEPGLRHDGLPVGRQVRNQLFHRRHLRVHDTVDHPSHHIAQVRASASGRTRHTGAMAAEATVRTLGGSPEAVDILFYDIARHDWATGGKLWSEPASPPAG